MRSLRFGVVLGLAVTLLAGGWWVGVNRADDKPVVVIRSSLPRGWKKLGLTPEQTQEVYKVRGTYRARVLELQEKIKKLQQEERKELFKVLTPAQRARLKEIQTDEPEPNEKEKAPVGKTGTSGKATRR